MTESTANTSPNTKPKEALQPETIREIETLLDKKDYKNLESLLEQSHAADIAKLLSQTDDLHRQDIIKNFGHRLSPETFSHLDPSILRKVVIDIAPIELSRIISALESDDALELISELPEDHRQEVLKHLTQTTRMLVEEGLTYPEDSAGRLMQREFISVPLFWTVGKTIDYLREAGAKHLPEFHDIIVLDHQHKVIGIVHLNRLLRSRRRVKMSEITDKDVQTIPVDRDQEDIAHDFRRYSLSSAPVIDKRGRMLGVITFDDIANVISEEASEDILALGGVQQDDLYKAALSTMRHRFSWLAVNLITAIIASIAISFFEATLEQVVALAILMPIVASMGGNAGTQTLTVAVRALATKELSTANAARIIGKETLVGLMNGIVFAALIGVTTALWFQSNALGMVIAYAMIINMLVAGIAGVLIPLILENLGADPAISSGVFLTTITDIIGFCTFLGLAAWLLF